MAGHSTVANEIEPVMVVWICKEEKKVGIKLKKLKWDIIIVSHLLLHVIHRWQSHSLWWLSIVLFYVVLTDMLFCKYSLVIVMHFTHIWILYLSDRSDTMPNAVLICIGSLKGWDDVLVLSRTFNKGQKPVSSLWFWNYTKCILTNSAQG